MSPSDLLAALERLALRWDLIGVITYGRPGSQISAIEALAHEISHHLYTGPDFEDLLRKMSPQTANHHEASALRVEVETLAQWGCKVPLRTLYLRANWRITPLPAQDARPTWAAMTNALTPREERCVFRMLRLVQQIVA